jgi:hypothetical protein
LSGKLAVVERKHSAGASRNWFEELKERVPTGR